MPITNIISSEAQGPGGQQSFRQLEQGQPRKLEVGSPEGPGILEAPEGAPKPEFLDLVRNFIGDVNDVSLQSGRAIDAFAAGEITDVHQVMVAVQEAGLALDLLLEIRNRTMESFQEIMRIQV